MVCLGHLWSPGAPGRAVLDRKPGWPQTVAPIGILCLRPFLFCQADCPGPGWFGGQVQDGVGIQSPPLEVGVEPAREVLLLEAVYGMVSVHVPRCPGIK